MSKIILRQFKELIKELDENTLVTTEVNIKTGELRCIIHCEISAKSIKDKKLWVEL